MFFALMVTRTVIIFVLNWKNYSFDIQSLSNLQEKLCLANEGEEYLEDDNNVLDFRK